MNQLILLNYSKRKMHHVEDSTVCIIYTYVYMRQAILYLLHRKYIYSSNKLILCENMDVLSLKVV